MAQGARGRLLAAACLVSVLMPAACAGAQGRLVVGDDPGGSLPARVAQVARLRAEGAVVEIRGRYCLSACTLYIGLPRACVSPATVFGFHGPSSRFYGISLPPRQFEHWSRVMAAHYPPRLRRWFMASARHVTMGFARLSGRELIALGVAACPGAAGASLDPGRSDAGLPPSVTTGSPPPA